MSQTGVIFFFLLFIICVSALMLLKISLDTSLVWYLYMIVKKSIVSFWQLFLFVVR